MSEPEGLFRDLTPAAPKASERPIYEITVRAEPGVDDTRALRHALKSMLRRFGLFCIDIKVRVGQ